MPYNIYFVNIRTYLRRATYYTSRNSLAGVLVSRSFDNLALMRGWESTVTLLDVDIFEADEMTAIECRDELQERARYIDVQSRAYGQAKAMHLSRTGPTISSGTMFRPHSLHATPNSTRNVNNDML